MLKRYYNLKTVSEVHLLIIWFFSLWSLCFISKSFLTLIYFNNLLRFRFPFPQNGCKSIIYLIFGWLRHRPITDSTLPLLPNHFHPTTFIEPRHTNRTITAFTQFYKSQSTLPQYPYYNNYDILLLHSQVKWFKSNLAVQYVGCDIAAGAVQLGIEEHIE